MPVSAAQGGEPQHAGRPKRPAPRVSHCRLPLQRPHLRNRQELCKQDADDAAADLPHKHGNQQIGLEIDVEGQEVPQAVSAAGQEGHTHHLVPGAHLLYKGEHRQAVGQAGHQAHAPAGLQPGQTAQLFQGLAQIPADQRHHGEGAGEHHG